MTDYEAYKETLQDFSSSVIEFFGTTINLAKFTDIMETETDFNSMAKAIYVLQLGNFLGSKKEMLLFWVDKDTVINTLLSDMLNRIPKIKEYIDLDIDNFVPIDLDIFSLNGDTDEEIDIYLDTVNFFTFDLYEEFLTEFGDNFGYDPNIPDSCYVNKFAFELIIEESDNMIEIISELLNFYQPSKSFADFKYSDFLHISTKVELLDFMHHSKNHYLINLNKLFSEVVLNDDSFKYSYDITKFKNKPPAPINPFLSDATLMTPTDEDIHYSNHFLNSSYENEGNIILDRKFIPSAVFTEFKTVTNEYINGVSYSKSWVLGLSRDVTKLEIKFLFDGFEYEISNDNFNFFDKYINENYEGIEPIFEDTVMPIDNDITMDETLIKDNIFNHTIPSKIKFRIHYDIQNATGTGTRMKDKSYSYVSNMGGVYLLEGYHGTVISLNSFKFDSTILNYFRTEQLGNLENLVFDSLTNMTVYPFAYSKRFSQYFYDIQYKLHTGKDYKVDYYNGNSFLSYPPDAVYVPLNEKCFVPQIDYTTGVANMEYFPNAYICINGQNIYIDFSEMKIFFSSPAYKYFINYIYSKFFFKSEISILLDEALVLYDNKNTILLDEIENNINNLSVYFFVNRVSIESFYNNSSFVYDELTDQLFNRVQETFDEFVSDGLDFLRGV